MRREGILRDAVCGDIRDQSTIDRLITAAGDTDALVNNVGGGLARPLAETRDEDFMRLFDLNLMTAARLARGLIARMAERGGGRIINVASVLAHHPVPTVVAYATSKAALIGFTRGAAIEFADRNVQVNAIAPGTWRPASTRPTSSRRTGRSSSDSSCRTGGRVLRTPSTVRSCSSRPRCRVTSPGT